MGTQPYSDTGIRCNEKADSASKSALELPRAKVVCPIMILNIGSTNIFFPLGKIVAVAVKLHSVKPVLRDPTGDAGRM